MAGRFFNQWQIGDKIVQDIRRTVTGTASLLFPAMIPNAVCPALVEGWVE